MLYGSSPFRSIRITNVLFLGLFFLLGACTQPAPDSGLTELRKGFQDPPATAQPGVYWYFMDGWISRAGIAKDLSAMKMAGINRVVFLEVNVGVPRGPVDFLSDQWLDLFAYAVKEAKRLGIEITLGIGPGWTGSGGPWVPLAASMQHLVGADTTVIGPAKKTLQLPLPKPRKPYFGIGGLTPHMKEQWNAFYKDVAVLAFPTPSVDKKLKDIDEKALYYRAPYSSTPGVKPYLPLCDHYPDSAAADIAKDKIIDLTDKLQPDGSLQWQVPKGSWTIMRFVSRNNGAVTRPAPMPGVGFESDKMDTVALDHHLNAYIGRLLAAVGDSIMNQQGGLKMLHMDSWEMGAQNWTPHFRAEFKKRRGYDPLPFYPVYAGYIVGSTEMSERFLWDLRQTVQELILQYHAGQVKAYAHEHGLGLSIEPYDMNPTADLRLGSIGDIPMAEFWSKGYGFNTIFSCFEATSIAHIQGEPIVQAEGFTANPGEDWKQYPGAMKNQGDWAFATGINRFFYHTFAHKPLADSLYPGMTMGPYGVHWDRKQTWWPMVSYYHQYISRCQFMLQQGSAVADILYLTPEGAPQVFVPPHSAFSGDSLLPDRRGYNFDGCAPEQLYEATVKDHQIVFPSGASYHVMVLPQVENMTPRLLNKVKDLLQAGAYIVGMPPSKAPGLSNYPECDQEVQALSAQIWGGVDAPAEQTECTFGEGQLIWGGALSGKENDELYPDYDLVAAILAQKGVTEDFKSNGPIRYTHRTSKQWDIYFVSNRIDEQIKADCIFRTQKGTPRLWDPLTGETRPLPEYKVTNTGTTVPMQFSPYQSFFLVFSKEDSGAQTGLNFPETRTVARIQGPWQVSFDPHWGGPAEIRFDSLVDWTTRPEDGIKYYSGIAVYQKAFDLSTKATDTVRNTRVYLNLGKVANMAHVWLNGKDLGVVWTAPWRVDITGVVKNKGNQLKIAVANLWPNRLIGDSRLPDDGIKDRKFPEWLVKGEKRTSGRYTFTTNNPYTIDSSLLESGLMGPVTIQGVSYDE